MNIDREHIKILEVSESFDSFAFSRMDEVALKESTYRLFARMFADKIVKSDVLDFKTEKVDDLYYGPSILRLHGRITCLVPYATESIQEEKKLAVKKALEEYKSKLLWEVSNYGPDYGDNLIKKDEVNRFANEELIKMNKKIDADI